MFSRSRDSSQPEVGGGGRLCLWPTKPHRRPASDAYAPAVGRVGATPASCGEGRGAGEGGGGEIPIMACLQNLPTDCSPGPPRCMLENINRPLLTLARKSCRCASSPHRKGGPCSIPAMGKADRRCGPCALSQHCAILEVPIRFFLWRPSPLCFLFWPLRGRAVIKGFDKGLGWAHCNAFCRLI